MRRLLRLFTYTIIFIAFFLGIVYVPSISNSDYLSQVEYFSPVFQEEDIETILKDNISQTRALYGLNSLDSSPYLNDSSLYRSIYLSQYKWEDFGDTFIRGPLEGQEIKGVFPYLDYEEIIHIEKPLYLEGGSLANYILRLLENKTANNYLLNNQVKHLGFSILSYGDNILCVLHWSKADHIEESENRVPENILKEDKISPKIFLSDIYIAKDDLLTDEEILASIGYEDNSQGPCTITYDKTSINTNIIDDYSLAVRVEDGAGNYTEGSLNIYVVPRIYPTIGEDKIIIPSVDFEDIYDIANYIEVLDTIGIKEIKTDPAFCSYEDNGITVEVRVINNAKLETVKEMEIVFAPIDHYQGPKAWVSSLYPQEGEPLTKEMIKGSISGYDEGASLIVDEESFQAIDLNQQGLYYCKVLLLSGDSKSTLAVPVHVKEKPAKGSFEPIATELSFAYYKLNKEASVKNFDHIVFEIEEELDDNILLAISIRLYGKNTYTIVKADTALVWNPTKAGLYDIIISTIDKNTRRQIKASKLSFFVKEKAYMSNTIPYLDIKEESLLLVDSKDKIITNIRPGNGIDIGTSVMELIDNFIVVDYNKVEADLRVKDINGKLLSQDALVGTGSVIELFSGQELFDSYVIVIYGDINGDGNINLADYSYIRQYILGKTEITGIRFKAANIAERHLDSINLADYSMLRQYILRKYEISQS